MNRYPETKFDRAIGNAIARENKAVIEEEHTGEFVDTDDRKWFRELLNTPEEGIGS